MVDKSDDDSGGGVGGRDIYGRRVKPVLVSLSDLCSKEEILICDSRPSSCSAYTSNYFF